MVSPFSPTLFIASRTPLASLLTTLTRLLTTTTPPPPLYLDLEGINLSRRGTVSVLTLHTPALLPAVYLIDIHRLQSRAFTTPCPLTGATLASILASPAAPKVFFDVRNDSDALFAHYGVRLRGVEDVQLMENAVRWSEPRGGPGGVERGWLVGLDRCVQDSVGTKGGGLLTGEEEAEWRAVKEGGRMLFVPGRGGGWGVFEERPMRGELMTYCVNDVVLLPLLRERYMGKLSTGWKRRVERETRKRVKESQSPGYEPDGEGKGLGPWRQSRGRQEQDRS
ncbi:piRNA biogenesis protein EXD1 [Podospora conica]|nr:piRNA biogenesis protein EXD1 [Schizothecium conicum]